jgi:hypothetical protein
LRPGRPPGARAPPIPGRAGPGGEPRTESVEPARPPDQRRSARRHARHPGATDQAAGAAPAKRRSPRTGSLQIVHPRGGQTVTMQGLGFRQTLPRRADQPAAEPAGARLPQLPSLEAQKHQAPEPDQAARAPPRPQAERAPAGPSPRQQAVETTPPRVDHIAHGRQVGRASYGPVGPCRRPRSAHTCAPSRSPHLHAHLGWRDPRGDCPHAGCRGSATCPFRRWRVPDPVETNP